MEGIPATHQAQGTACGQGRTLLRSDEDVMLLNSKLFLTHASSASELIPRFTPTVKTAYGVETAVVAGTGFLTFVNICYRKQNFHYALLENLG